MTAGPRRTAWYSPAASQGGPRGAAVPGGRQPGTPSPRRQRPGTGTGGLGGGRGQRPGGSPAGTPQDRRLSAPAPPVPQHRGGNGALSARRRREERLLPPRAPPGLPRAPGSGGPGLMGPAAPVLPARCWPESWAGAGQGAGLPRPGVTHQN